MEANPQPAAPPHDIDHEIGQDNVQILGLDIHNPVFVISAHTRSSGALMSIETICSMP